MTCRHQLKNVDEEEIGYFPADIENFGQNSDKQPKFPTEI